MPNKILLVDVDSKIPNLALMKLSTYYKNSGYKIKLKRLNYSGYPKKKTPKIINAQNYALTFVSAIFTVNKDVVKINGQKVYYGGTGFDLRIKLPSKIDDCEEDYSIYPDNNQSYGFITRGCIRNCPFCFVPLKEGRLYFYRHPKQVCKHKIFEFLDNNLLAYNNHLDVLQWFINNNIKCKLNQGLDIRLINNDNAKLLSLMNIMGEYVFAFDNIKDENLINKGLSIVRKYITKDWKLKFFLFVSPQYTTLKDDIYRILWCKNNKVLPYIMRHKTCWKGNFKNFYTDLAAYCNQPNIFKNFSFKQFIIKRTDNIDRRKKSLKLWDSNQ